MKTPTLLAAAGIFLGCGAAALGVVYVASPGDPFAPCRGETMIDHAAIGGGFELTDETGQRVTDAEVFDRPTLFYMGYTFCPDVCPLDNARNADAVYTLEDRGVDVRAVFVSVDPARDTPDVLTFFTDAFHPEMVGLTGTPDEVRALAEDYVSTFEIRNEGDDEYYLVDHTTLTFLVLPGHGVVDVIQRDETADAVAERAACMIGMI